jgi:hypothetical protein
MNGDVSYYISLTILSCCVLIFNVSFNKNGSRLISKSRCSFDFNEPLCTILLSILLLYGSMEHVVGILINPTIHSQKLIQPFHNATNTVQF